MPADEEWRGSAVEGAAVETADGLLFTVKGVIHPPDRVVAYLRYVPDPRGERARGRDRFRRVYSVAEQQEALRARDLSYRVERSGARRPGGGRAVEGDRARLRPPRAAAAPPRARARRLARGGCPRVRGAAARRRRCVAGRLRPDGLSALRPPHAGVGHRPRRVRRPGRPQGARGAHAPAGGSSSGLARPRDEELEAIHAVHREDTPLSAADFARLQARKVNEGRFAGRPYFIRFVKLPAEVPERYGDPRFAPAGMALVEARVTDDRDALFTPCRYSLDEVRSLDGARAEDVREVDLVSRTLRRTGAARPEGPRVRRAGTRDLARRTGDDAPGGGQPSGRLPAGARGRLRSPRTAGPGAGVTAPGAPRRRRAAHT